MLPLLPQDHRAADGREVRSRCGAGADASRSRPTSRCATSPSTPTRRCAASSRASAASARSLVLGGRQRQINVWLDADRLRAYNLTVTDVSRALQAQNAEIPGGRVEQGATSSRCARAAASSRVAGVRRHRRPRAGRPPGPARATSRASRTAMADAETRANVNGEPTVLLHVRRQSGTNTVAGRRRGQGAARRRSRPTLPPGYDIRVVRDLSDFIEASIDNVEEHLIVGSILAALVVLRVPGELALDDHRGDRHPDLDHRDLRPDLVHGLHAQLDDDAGADARGRHRHRRRDRRAGEHLPVHRGEGHDRRCRRRSRRRRKSAWPCWRRRCRWSRSSSRSASWAASSAAS